MPIISIISHFYNHPGMVEQQVEHWKRIDPKILPYLEFILVDDCSEDRPNLTRGNLNLRLFRVVTDIPWNQAGARNLAAFHAAGEWGLFFDIDQQINVDNLVVLLGNVGQFDKKTMYYLRANGIYDSINDAHLSNHPNTYFVNMSRFRSMGMFDEDFAGHYGYEDLYMPRVWEAAGGNRVLLNEPVFFDELGFRTTSFNRDLERNKQLMIQKLVSGCRNSPGILRFEWNEVEVL